MTVMTVLTILGLQEHRVVTFLFSSFSPFLRNRLKTDLLLPQEPLETGLKPPKGVIPGPPGVKRRGFIPEGQKETFLLFSLLFS